VHPTGLDVVADHEEPQPVERLDLSGDYDVEPPDLDDRYRIDTHDGEATGEVSA
jgi:hypothetical protein